MAHHWGRYLHHGALTMGVACAAWLGAPHAFAEEPAVLTIAPGRGGALGQDGGPGNEQPTVVTVTDDAGERYVVVISMSSDVEPGQGLEPWQCKCSSVRLSKDAPPEIVADQVYLTRNTNADRPCNHPSAATDGRRIVWAHGQNKGSGNTQTHAQAIDARCEPSYRIAAVDNATIGRPTIATYQDKALIYASRGQNRPPEEGVACAWINAVSGDVRWRDRIVAASDPANHVYMNQPSLAPLGGGRFALQVMESTGQGKSSDVKGATMVHLYCVTFEDWSAANMPLVALQTALFNQDPAYELGADDQSAINAWFALTYERWKSGPCAK